MKNLFVGNENATCMLFAQVFGLSFTTQREYLAGDVTCIILKEKNIYYVHAAVRSKWSDIPISIKNLPDMVASNTKNLRENSQKIGSFPVLTCSRVTSYFFVKLLGSV